jgi:hypothetical protein
MLLSTAHVSGLARGFSDGLSPWRAERSTHDPGKTVLDLAVAIALGGDCLADIGPVASDPTVSRMIDALAELPGEAIAAIRAARAAARARVWSQRTGLADEWQVVVDADATLIGAHSEMERATPNFKRGFGFHPMLAFVDHGTGEPLAGLLRPGRPTPTTTPPPPTRSPCWAPPWRSCPNSCARGCWSVVTPAPGSRGSSGTSTGWA